MTLRPFTQSWIGGTPESLGAQFVQAAVRFIDPAKLTAVPHMTARIVAERHQGVRPPRKQRPSRLRLNQSKSSE
jgi:hypothetical protein